MRQECEKRETERERERETYESERDSDAVPNRINDIPQQGQDNSKRGDEEGAMFPVFLFLLLLFSFSS